MSNFKNKLQKILGFEVEPTGNSDFGDYTANIAMVKAKSENKNPREYAAQLADKLKANGELSELVDKIEVAGPGFINFWLKTDVLVSNLIRIDEAKEDYGKGRTLSGKKIVLEFTDPNPFKEFHIGHVYTNTVGESLSRLVEALGATVHRVCYQGDVGLHVAKSIYGIQQKLKEENLTLSELGGKALTDRVKFMGEAYALGSRVYEEDQSTKEEINILNKKIFEKDKDTFDIYSVGRKWSLDYFETIYKRLGTKFNNYYFESEVGPVGKKIVEEGMAKGIFKESKGAVIFPGSDFGLHDRVFLNSLGLPTYEAKELGLAPTKYKDFKYDQSIIITGDEINEYFKVLIKAMSFIYPDLAAKTKHIGHGMVRLPEGKMSSRTGKVVTGTLLLDLVKSEASKINEESAEKVAIAAVKYAFLKVGIGKDVIYDVNESLSLEGNSGPYLQYTIARCNSVMQKAHIFKGGPLQDNTTIGDVQGESLHISKIATVMENDKWTMDNQESAVLRLLTRFSEVIEASALTYSPNIVCAYLYELAQKFNSFYNKDRIISDEPSDHLTIQPFRLALTAGVGQVLKNGLNLLGIQAPERM